MNTAIPRTLLALALLALSLAPAAFAGGTLEGKVVFTGQPKRNPLINMGADPNCLTINAGKKVIQELVALNPDKSVGSVFVHLTDDVAYSGGPPSEPLVVAQEGCTYHPRVSAAMIGQTLRVENHDSTLHNIHTQSDAGNSFNVGQPKAGMQFDHSLRGPEVMLRLKCDVHPWMTGFVGVKGNPYFAVTGDDGSFRIENIPAGKHTVQAWQERLGAVEQEIEIQDGETVTLELAFGPGGSANASAELPVHELAVR